MGYLSPERFDAWIAKQGGVQPIPPDQWPAIKAIFDAPLPPAPAALPNECENTTEVAS